jgi:hypothetical protein
MRENKLSLWELRVRDLRAYYDVEEDDEPVVYVRAVGVKVRNQVFIEGKVENL